MAVNDPLKQYNPDTGQWEGIKAGAISDGVNVITPDNVAVLDNKVTTHMADYVKHPAYGVTSSLVQGNYKVILDNPPIAYKDGMGLVLKLHAGQTGIYAIGVNDLPPKLVYKPDSSIAKNAKAGGIYSFRYSTSVDGGGGGFILQGEGGEYGTAEAAQVLTGYTVGRESGLVSGTLIPGKRTKKGSFTINGAVAVTGVGFRPRILSVFRDANYKYVGNEDDGANYYGVYNGTSVVVNSILVRTSDGFTIGLHSTLFPNGTWTYEAVE